MPLVAPVLTSFAQIMKKRLALKGAYTGAVLHFQRAGVNSG